MKIIISVLLPVIVILLATICHSEKVFASNEVHYWICAKCGWKTKSLDDYSPTTKQRIPCSDGTYYHTWREVDRQTYYEW